MRRKAWLALTVGGTLALGGGAALLAAKRSPLAQGGQAEESTFRQLVPLEAAEVIYEGKLRPGWDDWGWGPHELGKGPAKIVFQNYGGIMLHHAELPAGFSGLAFRFKAPESWADFLQVSLRWAGAPDDSFPNVAIEPRHIALLPSGWREVFVEWKELDALARPFDRVVISSRSSVDSEAVLLDRIILVKGAKPDAPSQREEALRVFCDRGVKPISELIYGGATDDWTSGQSARRIGGNPLTRANWELGAWNVGKDWYFENIGQKQTIFETVRVSATLRRKTALVVPMIGWVAKDSSSVGFPRSDFGEQQQFDPYKSEAGNGVRPDGTLIAPGSPLQTSIPAPPELIEKWVRQLTADDAQRGGRSVQIYILDNEPSLWNVTHRDVRPEPLGYDELLDRTIKYASAIRRADPGALIAGPAEWGWLGYQYSAIDREPGSGNKDRAAHGDVPLVAWYLRQLAAHEKATGTRLLDMLDLHFYPAAPGVFGEQAGTDPATNRLRVRSTRALWDPTYKDESWIAETIRLIPRMKDWVAENYPGTKLMLGEWSFGGDDHASGGVAAAEALGRFGQQGLDAAFFWGSPKSGSPVFWAFRAFRDFDGKGGRFQNLSLPAEESEAVALFASLDDERSRMVMVLVNRDPTRSAAVRVALQGCSEFASSQLFSYGGKSKSLAPGESSLKDGTVSATLEPSSINVIDLRLGRP
jgi:Glycoside hydrolase family 44